MLATVDAVGGENVANQAISQHQPIEDGVFAVGHIHMVVVGMKYIASISFGKDSLAMLLRLLEENLPLDMAVFYNTGMEFDADSSIQCILRL